MKPFNIFLIIFFLEMLSEKLGNSYKLKKNTVKSRTRKSKKQYNASYYPSYTESSNLNRVVYL